MRNSDSIPCGTQCRQLLRRNPPSPMGLVATWWSGAFSRYLGVFGWLPKEGSSAQGPCRGGCVLRLLGPMLSEKGHGERCCPPHAIDSGRNTQPRALGGVVFLPSRVCDPKGCLALFSPTPKPTGGNLWPRVSIPPLAHAA